LRCKRQINAGLNRPLLLKKRRFPDIPCLGVSGFESGSKSDYRSYAFALVHQVESLINFFQGQGMSDHWIDLDLAV
jgi:hypothetical protein